MAAAALGGLALCSSRGEADLLITPTLRSFTESFDWSTNTVPLLNDVFRFHMQLFLQPTSATLVIDLADDPSATLHPLPCGRAAAGEGGLVDLWQHEVGVIRARHDRVAARPGFIGVA
jgi:hypothetical protein